MPGPDLCEILRSQRVTALLGDRIEETRSGARDAGSGCGIEGASGNIALMVVPAARPEVLQAERAKHQKDPRNTIRHEAELGNAAFSSTSGRSTLFVVLRGDTLVMLRFETLDSDAVRRRDFARQVLTRF